MTQILNRHKHHITRPAINKCLHRRLLRTALILPAKCHRSTIRKTSHKNSSRIDPAAFTNPVNQRTDKRNIIHTLSRSMKPTRTIVPGLRIPAEIRRTCAVRSSRLRIYNNEPLPIRLLGPPRLPRRIQGCTAKPVQHDHQSRRSRPVTGNRNVDHTLTPALRRWDLHPSVQRRQLIRTRHRDTQPQPPQCQNKRTNHQYSNPRFHDCVQFIESSQAE